MSKDTAPKEYTFVLKVLCTDELLQNIHKYFKLRTGIFYNSSYTYKEFQHFHTSGHYKLNDIDVWISNQSKQGYFYIWFKCEEDYTSLIEYINKQKTPPQKIMSYPLYKYDVMHGWRDAGNYIPKQNFLIGYSQYLDTINKDIQNYVKYNQYLNSIGECSSLNYLLYGLPGTGKTTLINELCSKNNYPVFIVNPNKMPKDDIDKVLNPKRIGIKILLFEDFDRFMEAKDVSSITSQILNSLDGFDDNSSGIIRFFSANNPNIIFENEALVSRMNGKFKFEAPTRDMFEQKLKKIFTYKTDIDTDKMNKYLDLVDGKNISLRQFTKYTIRYLFDDEYLDNMIKNINDL
jgi:hypothetical protein